MDIKVKDIIEYIRTYQRIKLNNIDSGECFSPLYSDLSGYSDYYVTEIYADENNLVIEIKSTI